MQVQFESGFTHSSGYRVDRPFLRIDLLPLDSNCHIGIGVEKAKALSAIATDLELWVDEASPTSRVTRRIA